MDGSRSEGSEKRRGDSVMKKDKGGPVLVCWPDRPWGSLGGKEGAGEGPGWSWSRQQLDACEPCSWLRNAPALPGACGPCCLFTHPSLARHRGSEAVPRVSLLSRIQARTTPLSHHPSSPAAGDTGGGRRGRKGKRLRAELVRVNICGGGIYQTGLMRPRWSPGSSRCWFGARLGRGGYAAPGGGARLLAGAQHITPRGRRLGQQTPSRSELNWQHEGTGPGGGTEPFLERTLAREGTGTAPGLSLQLAVSKGMSLAQSGFLAGRCVFGWGVGHGGGSECRENRGLCGVGRTVLRILISCHQALLALPLLLLLLSTPHCAPQTSLIRGDGKQPFRKCS